MWSTNFWATSNFYWPVDYWNDPADFVEATPSAGRTYRVGVSDRLYAVPAASRIYEVSV